MCQVSLQFIAGCVQSFSNEITLLETDFADDITVAQMQCGIASVGSIEISRFDSKASLNSPECHLSKSLYCGCFVLYFEVKF